MTEETLLSILNLIELDLIWMLVKVLLVLFLALGIKNVIQHAVLYIKILVSDRFARNQLIEYNGFCGIISKISFRGITITNKNGDELFIPLDRWKYGTIIHPNSFKGRK